MVERKKGIIRPEDTEEEGDIELSPEEDNKAQHAIALADEQIESEREARFSCRWTGDALRLIKQVAAAMGVPYQTYIKQASYRCALEDLARIHAASGKAPKDLYTLEQLAKAASAELPVFARIEYLEQSQQISKNLKVRESRDLERK